MWKNSYWKFKTFYIKRSIKYWWTRKKVIEKFWDLNLIKKPQDIFNLNYSKIKNLDGWGQLSVNNLKRSIENSKTINFQRFIYSIGIRHIGIENAKIISDNVKNVSNFINLIETKRLDELLNIDGIGETQINSLKNFFASSNNLKTIIELSSILKIENKKFNQNGLFKNKSFMFTGKLDGISRAEAKSLIEKNSGITLSSINNYLNYLVVGEKPTLRKINKAKELGIKIISQKDLLKLLN